MTVQAVVFDIGNVLIRWEPEVFYDARIGPARRAEMFQRAGLEEMNLAIDRGADFRATVHDRAARHPEFADEIRHWHDSWPDFVTGVMDDSLSILRRLRAVGVPVYALSNFGLDPFSLAAARFPFLDEFDRRYLSGALGLIKPDPRIYEVVEADCGLPPDALFFTDDKPENVAAAQARGWQGHLFEGADGLEKALAAAGLPLRGAA